MAPLDVFSAATRGWFERAFAGPTPAQELGWPAIARGGHVLIQAPTGSGKTLAAFLIGIDRLNATPGAGLRLLYVSPLKALNYDIERNLRSPLAGLRSELAVAVRTGDTPPEERRRMLRTPPDILITTPESLFLLLTSQARETLRGWANRGSLVDPESGERLDPTALYVTLLLEWQGWDQADRRPLELTGDWRSLYFHVHTADRWDQMPLVAPSHWPRSFCAS